MANRLIFRNSENGTIRFLVTSGGIIWAQKLGHKIIDGAHRSSFTRSTGWISWVQNVILWCAQAYFHLDMRKKRMLKLIWWFCS